MRYKKYQFSGTDSEDFVMQNEMNKGVRSADLYEIIKWSFASDV